MGIILKDSILEYPLPPPAPPPTTNNSQLLSHMNASSNPKSSGFESSESEELQRLVHSPPYWKSNKKGLSKQLSLCETHRNVAWEKRRRQKTRQERRNKSVELDYTEDLTDEDLHELKGSIELGFGFKEEAGQKLCNTLPALDLYFAINRQLSLSPVSTPNSQGSSCSIGPRSSSFESPQSEYSLKFFGPGDDPQQVKMKLRHWAQAVACSVMQSI